LFSPRGESTGTLFGYQKQLSLLKKGGQFGFIVPNTILRTTVYDFVRRKILENYKINRIVDVICQTF